MNRAKKIFSSQSASVIVVIAAIIARAVIQIHFASFEGDKGFQVQAAQNFLDYPSECFMNFIRKPSPAASVKIIKHPA